MSLGKYILLEDGTPKLEEDVMLWAHWFESSSRTVERTKLGDEVEVSTVFLGMDHNFGGKGKPVLWETLVFGGPMDGEMDRYTSEEEARAGHQRMVERVKKA